MKIGDIVSIHIGRVKILQTESGDCNGLGRYQVQPEGREQTYWVPSSWLTPAAEPVMAGAWEKTRIRDGYPTLDVRPYPGPHIAGMVAAGGWFAYDPADNPLSSGPETGQAGRDKADACLRAAGHLPPLPAWVPEVGDRVVTPDGTVGTVREIRPPRPAYAILQADGLERGCVVSQLRPAPQPAPKVAPAWVRCDGAWIRRGVCWVRDSGGCHVPPSIPAPPRGEPIAVRRARMDAHLLAQGYTLEGGPVEGVQVVCRWRPETTVEQIRALRTSLRERLQAEGTDLQALWLIPISGSQAQVMRRHWAAYAAWLLAHPEAPIDWSIEVAP